MYAEKWITVWYGWHDYFFFQEDKEKWLAFQKKKWEFQSKQRAERKRLRKEADTMGISTLAVGRGPSTGLSTFMRQQARSLVDTPWQIIQVRFCNANECGGRWTCLWFMLLSSLCLIKVQAKFYSLHSEILFLSFILVCQDKWSRNIQSVGISGYRSPCHQSQCTKDFLRQLPHPKGRSWYK